MSQKSFNEKFKFLFIGQGQVDTWHHLRGISETSTFSNLELISKITISHKENQFHMVV